MAQKRMFDKSITNSDDFLELPDSSQVLYFHLSMNADDDGFINNWRSIIRMTGTKEDDLKILIAKQFVIPFDSGVIVIKHWRINNYLRNDRHKETNYKKELSLLTADKNEEYQLKDSSGIPTVYPDKNRIDKNRIDKNRIDKNNNMLLLETAQLIIKHLNELNNTHYRYKSDNTLKLIKARLDEGYSKEDLLMVVDKMSYLWNKEPKKGEIDMRPYLRPSTLFRKSNFENYYNTPVNNKKSLSSLKLADIDEAIKKERNK